MGEILFSSFAKCCCRYDLVIGCAIYVTVEVYMWAILSLTSFYTEIKMIENNGVVSFKNFTLNSSYYVTAFGSPSEEIGRTVIFTQIVINGIASVGFVLYCVFAVILLIGISERNLSYFILYLYLDSAFLYLSLLCIIIAALIQHPVMLRNSIIFALKFYPSSCIYSLFRKLGGLPLTFSNYTALAQSTPVSNPAIRLARAEAGEFGDLSNKSSSSSIKPKVSFTVDLTLPACSDPNLSPRIEKLGEAAILKTCFRKSLQIPVNNSYP